MKKKNIIIILEILFILWIILFIINIFLNFFEKKPLVVFKTNTYEYSDGKTTEYISLGYKVIHYDRSSKRAWNLTFIFTKIDNIKLTWQVKTKTEACKFTNETIYTENNIEYRLPCQSIDDIYILYSDGSTKTLKEVLDGKLIPINDLISMGLYVDKYKLN